MTRNITDLKKQGGTRVPSTAFPQPVQAQMRSLKPPRRKVKFPQPSKPKGK